jgi:hypothetical protein
MTQSSEMRSARDVVDALPQPAHDTPAHDLEPPTVRPSFDPAEFARESESTLRNADEPSSTRPTLPPPSGKSSPPCDALAVLGADAVPVLAVSRDELGWLGLSPDAADFAARVNGVSSLETLSSKARVTLEAGAGIALELAAAGVVTFR